MISVFQSLMTDNWSLITIFCPLFTKEVPMAGIEPTPKEERNLGGWDFFLLWAGAAISSRDMGRESDRSHGIGFGALGCSPWPPHRQHAVRFGRFDWKPMGHSNDGCRSTLFWNQRFLLCLGSQCHPAHWLDSRDAHHLRHSSRRYFKVVWIF